MNNQNKKGFSLVEVMILFAVLAVAMAAMLPVITTKSHPVPRKVPHGVYRCIADNGGYREEIFNSFRRLSRRIITAEQAAAGRGCQFNVPNANIYVVDLYAAGAGGTKYAAYHSEGDGTRRATLGMNEAADYARGGGLGYVPQDQARRDMPFEISDDMIYDAFHTESVTISAYSADAESGGDARISYLSPANAKCLAVEFGADKSTDANMLGAEGGHGYTYTDKRNKAFQDMIKAENDYNDAEEKYDNELKSLNGTKDTITERIQADTDLNAALAEGQKALMEYQNAMSKVVSDVNSIKTSSVDHADKWKYFNDLLSYLKSVDNDGYNISDIYNNHKTIYIYGYNFSADRPTTLTFVQNDSLTYIRNYNNQIIKWANQINEYMQVDHRYFTDEYVSKRLNNIITYINNITTQTNQWRSFLQSRIEEIPPRKLQLEEALPLYEGRITDKESERDSELKSLDDDRKEKSDIFDTATKDLEARYKVEGDAYVGRDIRPEIYNNNTSYRYDDHGYTGMQINDYCHSKYLDYYTAHPEFVNLFEAGDMLRKGQSGGDRGSGVRVALTYNLKYGDAQRDMIRKRYPARNLPYLQYVGSLFGNIDGMGYAAARCNQAPFNGANCEIGAVESPVANSNKHNTDSDGEIVPVGNGLFLKRAQKGQDVRQILAFHVPQIPNFGGAGEFTSLIDFDDDGQPMVAKGGNEGVVGYQESEHTYNKGDNDFSKNVAQLVFRGSDPSEESKFQANRGDNASAMNGMVRMVELGYTGTTYSMDRISEEDVRARQPRLDMSANMWRKSYKIGNEGSAGEHKFQKVPTLGTRCTFAIPQAGPTFDYVAVTERTPEGMSEQDFRRLVVSDYENGTNNSGMNANGTGLNASMTCFDKDNVEVYHLTANGGRYDINLGDWSNPFIWNRDVHSWSTRRNHSISSNPSYHKTSRWAKIFFNFNQMDSLRTYRVGAGGSSTGLTDNCLEPRGTFSFRTTMLESTNGINWNEIPLRDLAQENLNMSASGFTNDNVDCYRDDVGSFGDNDAVRDHTRTLDNRVQGGNMTERERELYQITDPIPAGGGAVVITW